MMSAERNCLIKLKFFLVYSHNCVQSKIVYAFTAVASNRPTVTPSLDSATCGVSLDSATGCCVIRDTDHGLNLDTVRSSPAAVPIINTEAQQKPTERLMLADEKWQRAGGMSTDDIASLASTAAADNPMKSLPLVQTGNIKAASDATTSSPSTSFTSTEVATDPNANHLSVVTSVEDCMQKLIKQNEQHSKRSAEETKMLTCAYCKLSFECADDIFHHYDVVHDDGLSKRAGITNKNIRSNRGGAADVDDVSKLKSSHLKQCQRCPMCYIEIKSRNYEKHVLLVHYWSRISKRNIDQGCYTCNICKKDFTFKRNLQLHEK